jgi:MerR family transcriptional regulator/heat shock protein HspR
MYTNTTAALMRKTGQRLYTIGEAADLIGVSVPTIRMYEREGLIIPIRKESRHRLFADTDLERIRSVRKSINTGKGGITGIRRMMAELPCWQIKGCPEEARAGCRAYLDHDAPCWMASEKSWKCKSTECRHCVVYTGATGREELMQTLEVYAVAAHPDGPAAE